MAGNGSTGETTSSPLLQVFPQPAARAGVSAQLQGDNVAVSGTAPTPTLPVTYSVYRSDYAGASFVLAAGGLTTTSYTDAYLPGSAAVIYVVTATDAVGNESAYSGPATITTPASWNLQAPSLSLQALIDAGASRTVAATASSHSGITSVAFAFAPAGGGWLPLPIGVPVPSFLGGGPSIGQTAGTLWAARWNTSSLAGSYQVKAIAADSAGRTSEQVRNVTFSGSAPRGPPAVALTATSIAGGVRLTWPSAGVTYQVRRSTTGIAGSFKVIATASSGTYDDLNLSPTSPLTYQLWDSVGAVSDAITATPLIPGPAQAIVTQAAGGSATSAHGSATITLSPRSVATTPPLPLTHPSALPTGIVQLSPVFDLKAVDVATGAAIDSFATAPVLTIHYDPSGPPPTSIFYIDPSGQAVAVPSTVDTVAHPISAALPHFSAWVDGTNPPTLTVQLTATLATVDLTGTTSSTLTVTASDPAVRPPTPTPTTGAPVGFSTPGVGSLDARGCSTGTNGAGQCSVVWSSSVRGSDSVTATINGVT